MGLALFLVVNNFNNEFEIKHFLLAIILVAVLVSIIGLIQYYFPNRIEIQSFIRQAIPPASTFGNKNMAAHFLVMTLPLALVFMLYENTVKKIVFYAVSSIMIAWFLIHTNTRAGWFSVMVELVFLLIFLITDYKKHRHNPFLFNQVIHWQKIIIIISGVLIWFVLINYTNQGWQWHVMLLACLNI